MIRYLSYLFIGACLAIIIGEMSLRIWFRVRFADIRSAYKYDAETGVTLKSELNSLELSDYLKEVVTNQVGTANFQEDFSKYKRLLFVIGDSYVQGIGLPADMSFPAQLDLTLNLSSTGEYSPEYGVVNLGVGGFGAEQSVLRLKKYVQLLGRPDAILYLGCDNDFDDDRMFEAGIRHRHIVEGNPRLGSFSAPLVWLSENSEILARLKLILFKLNAEKENGAQNLRADKPKNEELERKQLADLKIVADSAGARLIVSWANSGDSYGVAKSWSLENGVGFADWYHTAASVQHEIPRLPLKNPHSGVHYRGWVNRIISDSFAKAVKER